MPKLYDRRTGNYLGRFTEQECVQLRAMLQAPPAEDEPYAVDPNVIERYAEAGASDRVLAVVHQILQDPEDFDPDWEPDD